MTEQIYTDKEILADALTAEKAATNNYNAFANECVHQKTSLNYFLSLSFIHFFIAFFKL